MPVNLMIGPRNPMNNPASASYIPEIHRALLSFQMIEEALKICVGLSYEIIERSVPAPVVFRFNPNEINSAPLGKLITMFSAVSRNAALVSDLKKIKEWRNFCAHNAFAHEFLDRASASPFTAHNAEDVGIVVKFSGALVERIGDEIKTLQELHRTGR